MPEAKLALPNASDADGITALQLLPVQRLRQPLGSADLRLLARFDIDEPSPETLAVVNQSVFTGSLDLSRSRELASPDEILEARTEFYIGFMRFGDPSSRFFTAFARLNHKRLGNMLPPLTFLATHRVFDVLGADVSTKLAQISYSPERTRQTAILFSDRGLNAAKIAIKSAQAFGHSEKAIDDCIKDIENEGFSRKMLEKFPQFIGFDHLKRIERLRGQLDRHGEIGATMVEREATILGAGNAKRGRLLEHTQAMIDFLNLPCTALELVEAQPSISNFSKSKIIFLFTMFQRFGQDLKSKHAIARCMTVAPHDYLLAISKGMTKLTSYKMVNSLISDVPKPDRDNYVESLITDPLFVELAGPEVVAAYSRWKESPIERIELRDELAALKRS